MCVSAGRCECMVVCSAAVGVVLGCNAAVCVVWVCSAGVGV